MMGILYERITMKVMKSMKKGVFDLLSGCLIYQNRVCSDSSSVYDQVCNSREPVGACLHANIRRQGSSYKHQADAVCCLHRRQHKTSLPPPFVLFMSFMVQSTSIENHHEV